MARQQRSLRYSGSPPARRSVDTEFAHFELCSNLVNLLCSVILYDKDVIVNVHGSTYILTMFLGVAVFTDGVDNEFEGEKRNTRRADCDFQFFS